MNYESRMLIDGELVEAEGGRAFDNLNPATEAVIGPVADASAADMERAIGAARRAFDDTTWSTDRAFRKACLMQLKEALDKHKVAKGEKDELIGALGPMKPDIVGQ